MNVMNILGIETSCDETAAAVVQDGNNVLSNTIASSLKFHQKYKGVIPEIASRRQLEFINTVVDTALADAGMNLKKIHAIAVTARPGLIGSLLVGNSFARALSRAIKKPLIEIDHIQAHLYANFLSWTERKSSRQKVTDLSPCSAKDLPVIGLVVSGGHTSLYLIKDFTHFKLLGQTRDDAAGEAFDKVARILNLGYPGGPVIDRLAQKKRTSRIKFAHARLPGTSDFSFSGVKTAVLYYQRDHGEEANFSQAEVAYAFQKSVVDILVKKSILACQKHKVKTLVVGGGVAANSALREKLSQERKENAVKACFPPISLCMDNAAMIAGLAYHRYKNEISP